MIYFGPESAQRVRLREHVRFPPDLAIEVLSPSTARIDLPTPDRLPAGYGEPSRGRKRDLLGRYGVPEYWVVDPDLRQLEVWTLTAGQYREPSITQSGRYQSATLLGLTIDFEALLAGLE